MYFSEIDQILILKICTFLKVMGQKNIEEFLNIKVGDCGN